MPRRSSISCACAWSRLNFPPVSLKSSCAPKPLPPPREQLRLFTEKPTRDLDAANRALARLRAEFGDEAVVQAKLTDGHLPEARFAWEPLTRIKLPQNGLNRFERIERLERTRTRSGGLNAGTVNPYCAPHHRQTDHALRHAPCTHEDGWLGFLGPKYGSVDKLTGPYVFSGGWWNREIQREYYYAETRRGDLLWLYYDRVRRRWFLQGAVE